MPGRLLLRPLGVQRDQTLQDLLVAQIAGPAIGVGCRRIDLVVQVLQDQHQAALLDVLVGGAQRGPGPQLLQHIVQPGQGQVGMLGQDPLAGGVEFLS